MANIKHTGHTKHCARGKGLASHAAGGSVKPHDHVGEQLGGLDVQCDLTIPFLGIYWGQMKAWPMQNLYTDTHNIFISNSPKLETAHHHQEMKG